MYMETERSEMMKPSYAYQAEPQERTHATPRYTHSCHAWWTGLRTAHCAACHRTFVSVRAFDLHRNRDYDTHLHGACFDPATVGLARQQRTNVHGTYEVWGYRVDDENPNPWGQRSER